MITIMRWCMQICDTISNLFCDRITIYMNRKYLLIKSVEIYVEHITDHWYSIVHRGP